MSRSLAVDYSYDKTGMSMAATRTTTQKDSLLAYRQHSNDPKDSQISQAQRQMSSMFKNSVGGDSSSRLETQEFKNFLTKKKQVFEDVKIEMKI